MLDRGAHKGLYYVVKNSWGEISDYKGYVYVSRHIRAQHDLLHGQRKRAAHDIRKRLGFEQGEVIIPAPPAGEGSRGTAPAKTARPGTGQLKPSQRFSPKKDTPAQQASRATKLAGKNLTPQF